jgi:hypothetical protein
LNQVDATSIPAGKVAFSGNPTFLPGTVTSNPINDTGQAEQALLQKIHEEKAKAKSAYGHTKVIKRLGDQRAQVDQHHGAKHQPKHQAEPSKQIDPKLIQLATNNDLNVSTIAHEAEKATKPLSGADGEVVISLR